MPKYAEFLWCEGTPEADKSFLIEFQKSVLYTLQKEGVLDQFQTEECIKRLVSQRL